MNSDRKEYIKNLEAEKQKVPLNLKKEAKFHTKISKIMTANEWFFVFLSY